MVQRLLRTAGVISEDYGQDGFADVEEKTYQLLVEVQLKANDEGRS